MACTRTWMFYSAFFLNVHAKLPRRVDGYVPGGEYGERNEWLPCFLRKRIRAETDSTRMLGPVMDGYPLIRVKPP